MYYSVSHAEILKQVNFNADDDISIDNADTGTIRYSDEGTSLPKTQRVYFSQKRMESIFEVDSASDLHISCSERISDQLLLNKSVCLFVCCFFVTLKECN